MNRASGRASLNASAILGAVVIFAAASCGLTTPLQQDGGTSGQDSGHTCLPTGAACQYCPNGYLDDANGCATCQCKPTTTCGAKCVNLCGAYGYVLDAQGCPTCACNPPPTGSCSASECGPAPGAPSQLCSDGKTIAGPICLRDQTGVCGWRITTCPTPPACTTDQCPSPRPAGPNALCPDGKTVSGPACVASANGTCGWTQITCPPTCVDTVLCIQGDHWDSTLCQCVPDPPAPGPCPCATGQICVTQIGGPAIPNPPPSHCEAPDQSCLARVDTTNPCACLAATDGKCTSSSVGNCTCDNGIR